MARETSKSKTIVSLSQLYNSSVIQPRVNVTVDNLITSYIAYYGSVRTSHSREIPFGNAQSELGANLNSFVPTLWEWLPYSWLADYFSNMGHVISALSFPTSDIIWVNRLIRNTIVSTISYSKRMAIPFNPDVKIIEDSFYSSPWVFSNKYHNRSVSSKSLVPAFRLRLPGNPGQWATVVALTGALASRNKDTMSRLLNY
jgi:hypothetical protein